MGVSSPIVLASWLSLRAPYGSLRSEPEARCGRRGTKDPTGAPRGTKIGTVRSNIRLAVVPWLVSHVVPTVPHFLGLIVPRHSSPLTTFATREGRPVGEDRGSSVRNGESLGSYILRLLVTLVPHSSLPVPSVVGSGSVLILFPLPSPSPTERALRGEWSGDGKVRRGTEGPPFIPLLAGSSLRFPSLLPSSERASGGEGRGEGRSDPRTGQ